MRQIGKGTLCVILFCMIFGMTGCTEGASESSTQQEVTEVTDTPAEDVKVQADHKELPNIVILGTGGTIAGAAKTADQTAGYRAAAVDIDSILEAVPGLEKVANVSAEQYCQIASENMTPEVWLGLSKYVTELLSREDVDGVVITHGTDTLEETAYFLNLTVKSDKPVVLVGAMLPSTATSADGPLNIYNGVTVAGAKESRGKGVMVSMNQEILAARHMTKGNTIQTDTFQGNDEGILGYVQNGQVEYYQESLKKHTTESEFDIREITQLPRVEILYQYAGTDPQLLDYMLREVKPDGLVIAAVGDGSFPQTMRERLENRSEETVIIRASRTGDGIVIRNGEVDDDTFYTATANNLNPQKARILLMLALTKTKDINQIQQIMDRY